MISERNKGLYAVSIIGQIVLSQALFWILFIVSSTFYANASLYLERYFIYSLVALGGLVVEAISRRDLDCDWTDKSILEKHNAALRQSLYAAGSIIFFTIATKDRIISRVFLFSYLPLLYLLLLGSARTLPDFVIHFLFHRFRHQHTLLVGPIKSARALKQWIDGKKLLGFEVEGVISDESNPSSPGLPYLGSLKDFQKIVREKQISHIILVEPPGDSVLLWEMISACERLGLRLLVVSDLQQRFRHKIIYIESGDRHFIALREEPLENPVSRVSKRLLDIAIALPAVIFILPPVCALVWILHRLQSPGPLFYVQARVGFQNRSFSIIKFRTMRAHNPDAAKQASRNDQRIFPAGKWLRKFSVDELPQFWNVLQGQMSVVGPRPHLREHDDEFSRVLNSYYIRSLVKPGITGLAQVRGFRGEALNEEALRQRVESDLYYLENWSFAADLMIILRTAWQVIFPPKSAY